MGTSHCWLEHSSSSLENWLLESGSARKCSKNWLLENGSARNCSKNWQLESGSTWNWLEKIKLENCSTRKLLELLKMWKQRKSLFPYKFEGFFKYERVWSFGADGHHGRSVCFLLMSLKTEDGPGVSLRTAQGTSPLVWSTEEFVACDVRGLLAHAVSKIACVPLAVACD